MKSHESYEQQLTQPHMVNSFEIPSTPEEQTSLTTYFEGVLTQFDAGPQRDAKGQAVPGTRVLHLTGEDKMIEVYQDPLGLKVTVEDLPKNKHETLLQSSKGRYFEINDNGITYGSRELFLTPEGRRLQAASEASGDPLAKINVRALMSDIPNTEGAIQRFSSLLHDVRSVLEATQRTKAREAGHPSASRERKFGGLLLSRKK